MDFVTDTLIYLRDHGHDTIEVSREAEERWTEMVDTGAADLDVLRYELPNLNALNFVVVGLIAPGVAATARPDAQAKGLGEYLRSRTVLVPAELLA